MHPKRFCINIKDLLTRKLWVRILTPAKTIPAKSCIFSPSDRACLPCAMYLAEDVKNVDFFVAPLLLLLGETLIVSLVQLYTF